MSGPHFMRFRPEAERHSCLEPGGGLTAGHCYSHIVISLKASVCSIQRLDVWFLIISANVLKPQRHSSVCTESTLFMALSSQGDHPWKRGKIEKKIKETNRQVGKHLEVVNSVSHECARAADAKRPCWCRNFNIYLSTKQKTSSPPFSRDSAGGEWGPSGTIELKMCVTLKGGATIGQRGPEWGTAGIPPNYS